jgi:hypothetical protein
MGGWVERGAGVADGLARQGERWICLGDAEEGQMASGALRLRRQIRPFECLIGVVEGVRALPFPPPRVVEAWRFWSFRPLPAPPSPT